MNKFKKISAILILVILIAAICLFAGCDDGRAQSAEASLDFDGLGSDGRSCRQSNAYRQEQIDFKRYDIDR